MQRPRLITIFCSAALAGSPVLAERTLHDFSALMGGYTFYVGTWAGNGSATGDTSPAAAFVQGDGVLEVTGTGVTNDAESYLEVHSSAAPLDLSDSDAISLTATALAANTATSIEVRLFDTAGGSAFATFEIASLPAVATWIPDRAFDSSAVEIVRVSGGQLDGDAAFAVSFDEVLAIAANAGFHDADYDRDHFFNLSELLRLIELYNTRNGTTRTGRYLVNAATADGYGPDPDTVPGEPANLARFHSADSDRDAAISLSELLRVIELYNYRSGTTRTGEYHRNALTTDGFATGPEPGT